MAAAAELRLLEKSLGLKPGNKYSAQGERQVRRGGRKAEGWRGSPEPTRPVGTREWTPLPTCVRGGPGVSASTARRMSPSSSEQKASSWAEPWAGIPPGGGFSQRSPCEPSRRWGGCEAGDSPSWRPASPKEQYKALPGSRLADRARNGAPLTLGTPRLGCAMCRVKEVSCCGAVQRLVRCKDPDTLGRLC